MLYFVVICSPFAILGTYRTYTESSLSGFAGLQCSQSNSLVGGHEIISGWPLGLKSCLYRKLRDVPLYALEKIHCFKVLEN